MSRKRLLTILSAFFLVVIISLTVLYSRANAPPYHFLEGHKPHSSKIDDRFLITDRQDYSWDGNFDEIRKQMVSELTPLGFKETFDPQAPMITSFYKDGLSIVMVRGMYKLHKGSLNPLGGLNGVTITIDRTLPNSWLTKVRRWLQR